MSQVDYTKPLEINRPGYSCVEYVKDEPSTDPQQVRLRVTENGCRVIEYIFYKDTGIFVGHEQRDDALRVRNASETEVFALFSLHCGKDSWAKTNWQKLPTDRYEFRDAKEAAAMMKKMNLTAREEESDWRFIIKKHVHNAASTDWQSWMQKRFEAGEYKPVIWAGEDWANRHPEHFVHPALSNFDAVAFIQNATYGVMDQLTVMSAGRYLKSYYGDILSDDDIAMWSAKFDTESVLEFGDTPEYFTDNYKSAHLGSCMGYSKRHFGLVKNHPVEIYGAGDLSLAILKRHGSIVARAIVTKQPKRWIRLYGDNKRLMAKLVALGYKPAASRHLEGLRLLNIPAELDGYEAVIMPYLDLGMHSKPHPTDSNLLVMSRTGTIPGNGHRYGRAIPQKAKSAVDCGCCGDTIRYPDTDGGFVGGGYNRVWCNRCVESRTVLCDFTNEYYDIGDSAHALAPVYNPVTLEVEKRICVMFADEFEDQVQKVGTKYYLTEGLVYNSTTKLWSLPEQPAERKAA